MTFNQWFNEHLKTATGNGWSVADIEAAWQAAERQALERAAERVRRIEVLDKLFWLASRDVIFFGSYNTALCNWDEHWHPAVGVNDTFYYASADAEDLKEEEIDGLIDVVKKFSHDGVTAWAARRRGMEPIKQQQTDKYREAVAYLAALQDAQSGEEQK